MGAKLNMHVENSRHLGPVFEVTKSRITKAIGRFPGLRQRLRITIGYDGETFAKQMQTADMLFSWAFDTAVIAKGAAPRLKWVHAHGAGINHLLPLDWLPANVTLTSRRGIPGEKAGEYTAMELLMMNN